MARRNDHSREEIKEMALDATIAILRDEGVQGLSTRKVAQAIGYTVGTLYLVFKNLDELVLHVNARTLEDLKTTLNAAAEPCKDARQCLENLALAYLEFAQMDYARWSLLFSHQLAEGRRPPEWFEQKVRELFYLVHKPLNQLATNKNDKQIEKGARALWGAVHGICILGLSDKLSLGGEVHAEDLIKTLLDNYLAGYAAG